METRIYKGKELRPPKEISLTLDGNFHDSKLSHYEVKVEEPKQIDVTKLCDEYAQCWVSCSLLSIPLDEQQKTYKRMEAIIQEIKQALQQ